MTVGSDMFRAIQDILLREYGATISSVSSEPEYISLGAQSFVQQQSPMTVEFCFHHSAYFKKFVESVVGYHEAELRREELIETYPALKEAYEYYKSIEIMCDPK